MADPVADPWWAKYLLLLVGWFLGLLTKECSDRITSLVRGPRIQLDFGNTDDCVTLTPEKYEIQNAEHVVGTQQGNRVVFFARIKVTNAKLRIARHCQA